MRGLPAADSSPQVRVRRWDAVVLGAALPGLVAAARLGMHGARVLVLEEAAATARASWLREPFYLGGIGKQGILGACLRALSIPLIDQRRFEPAPLAFQVLLPDARLDVGEPRLTVDEWVGWGLARPDEARALAAGLLAAATAEREAMLRAPVVKARRLSRGARRSAPLPPVASADGAPRARGLPSELQNAPPRIAAILAAQVRALSNLAGSAPSKFARARLLGAPLEGGVVPRGSGTLFEVLRRRVESLYGEFRTLPDRFRMVSANGQPGVAPDADGELDEVWVGRAFLVNAPRAALALAVSQSPVPEPIRGPAATHRRAALHLRVPREAVPEALAPRALLLNGDDLDGGRDLVSLRRAASDEAMVDFVATSVVPADAPDLAARADRIEARVAALLPFASGRLERIDEPTPVWDDDALLADPDGDGGWPAEADVRLPTRQPIYSLDRSGVAGLGFEGDVLLGWRAGDAIAADLA